MTTAVSARALADVRSVAVGSGNPVKLAATRAVITRVAPDARVSGVSISSTVRDQPIGDDETMRGALARARGARDAVAADLGIGIEGGVVVGTGGSLRTCAWAAVVSANGRESVGGSLAMPLPGRVAALIRDEHMELGAAMDRLVGERNTKQGRGAVGILTAGLIDRQAAYEAIITYALAPFLTPELWAISSA